MNNHSINMQHPAAMGFKTQLGVLLVAASSLLAGCALQLPPSYPEAPEQPRTQPEQPDTGVQPLPDEHAPEVNKQEDYAKRPKDISNSAVMSLLNRADQMVDQGHPDQAASLLQRALDIEPRNPFIYQRLAAIRLAQKRPGQAESMAQKSNSLSGDNPYILKNNWRLIAAARQAAGNTNGQQEAEAKVADYSQKIDAL